MRRAIALLVLTWAGAAIATAQAASPPVFTSTQADAGRAAYSAHCAECHMPDLSGNNEKPPLAGPTFMSTWGGRTTKELLDYMSGAMPFGGPSLDPAMYLALTAYILQSNGAAAGSDALLPSTVVRIGSLACTAGANRTLENACPAKANLTTH